jgi:hypothetical protein
MGALIPILIVFILAQAQGESANPKIRTATIQTNPLRITPSSIDFRIIVKMALTRWFAAESPESHGN